MRVASPVSLLSLPRRSQAIVARAQEPKVQFSGEAARYLPTLYLDGSDKTGQVADFLRKYTEGKTPPKGFGLATWEASRDQWTQDIFEGWVFPKGEELPLSEAQKFVETLGKALPMTVGKLPAVDLGRFSLLLVYLPADRHYRQARYDAAQKRLTIEHSAADTQRPAKPAPTWHLLMVPREVLDPARSHRGNEQTTESRMQSFYQEGAVPLAMQAAQGACSLKQRLLGWLKRTDA